MPVELPTVEEGYGRFVGAPSQANLERCFFLDDRDLALVAKRRGEHRMGCGLQLGTLRFLGTLLVDPTAVPTEVADHVAEQVGGG